MKQTKHTPGPWVINGGEWVDAENNSVCRIVSNIPANAALISAAPEMLEALESALERIGILLKRADLLDERNAIATVLKIENAIAKARGES